MFTYRLHLEDGTDVGEAAYPQQIKVGDDLFFGGGRRFRVVDTCPVRRGGRIAVRRAATGGAGVADRFRAQSALSTAFLMSGIESRSSAPRAEQESA
jgi:hypothetical protein